MRDKLLKTKIAACLVVLLSCSMAYTAGIVAGAIVALFVAIVSGLVFDKPKSTEG